MPSMKIPQSSCDVSGREVIRVANAASARNQYYFPRYHP
jgi:hypothetical protein